MNTSLPGSGNWAPWYVIAWRLIWYVPVVIARCLFVLILGIGWGLGAAERAWRDTE